MDDWILNRLSPVKDSDPRWTGLAKAIQQFWEENFDPLHFDLINLRSIYTMSQPDLALKMREKGDFFSPDWPTEYDQPLAVAWREGEILRKSTEYIIKSTFRRNFKGIDVEWAPLYAPKIGDYGSSFITGAYASISGADLEGDYWITSRGKVSVDLESMYNSSIDWTMESFSTVVDRMVNKIKPAHIVFDGVLFKWDIYIQNVNNTIDCKFSDAVNVRHSVEFVKRYDIVRADDDITDESDACFMVFGQKTSINGELSIINKGPFFDDIPLDKQELDYNYWL